ncbi:alpha/beta fold hydrolase [Streptomyces sp. TRM68367]|uniref:alpha/beta fold hydrolase n=1 Tax=Streptomyces sp. TRM68367 TaxID=2758415 RepID=UPI001CA931B9|nr:alpha/beta hydrolase [Streptomyces sp. TRM68367]
MSANAWAGTGSAAGETAADSWTEAAEGSTPAADWTETPEGSAPAADWTAARKGSVPTAVLLSAHDVTIRRWAERDHTISRWTELDRGGHFLSLEAPDLLVADIREFFGKPR